MAVRYGSVGVATTRTVPPAPVAAGGGGGPSLPEWTKVPLTMGGFTIYGDDPSHWVVSNPSPGTLRVAKITDTVKNWDNHFAQDGVVLIWPVVLDPFVLESVSGFTTKQWRGSRRCPHLRWPRCGFIRHRSWREPCRACRAWFSLSSGTILHDKCHQARQLVRRKLQLFDDRERLRLLGWRKPHSCVGHRRASQSGGDDGSPPPPSGVWYGR